MSIKSFQDDPSGGISRFTLFLAFSILVHFAFVSGLILLEPSYKHLYERLVHKDEPVIVDVVELPPGPDKPARPDKPAARYADRNSTVEKETVPGKKISASIRPGTAEIKQSSSRAAAPALAQKERVAVKELAAPKPPAQAQAAPLQKDTAHKAAISEKPQARTEPGGAAAGDAGAVKRPVAQANSAPARPNLLLSGDKITELEKRYESEAPKGEQGKTLQLNTTELRYQKYLVNMKNRIELYWEYPDLAVRNAWQGKLQIRFTIKKDGTLGEVSLVKSSGYPVLDDSAVTALRLAAPFPPFPDNFGIEQITINGQFEYNLVYIPQAR